MDVIVHVGLHKTATTFLQERFFPGLAATFVHAPHVLGPAPDPIQRFVHALLFRNAATLDVEAHREAITAFVRARPSPLIVSSEALFGWPFENHVNFRTNADVLAEVLPEAKIWLVLRRQDHWLESAYSQILKQGLSTSPQRFTNYRRGEFVGFNWNIYNGPNLDVRDLDWTPYVEHYRRRFGVDRVKVQAYEAFVENAQAFLAEFCQFAGVPLAMPPSEARVNPALGPASAWVARVVNALPASLKLELKRHVPAQYHPAAVLERTLGSFLPRSRPLVPEEIKTAVLAMHRENNARLARLTGLDLARYGYCA